MVEAIVLQAPQGGQSGWMSILMMVLIFVVFYFFMIRPQQKKQKELQNFRDSLMVGDKVLINGGIQGKIKTVNDATVVVEIANNVNVTVMKEAIIADPTSVKSAEVQK